MTTSSYPQQPLPKREISFPPDSIEATLPVLYRRKRICRMDLNNVDAWRLMMCLRSGLLSETTYALDMLNILLFDDATVPYFGLSQWPGLLDLLLEHFRKSLVDMFDNSTLDEPDRDWYMHNDDNGERERDRDREREREQQHTSTTVDLGAVDNDDIDSEDKTVLLTKTPNYTHTSRKDQVIRQVERNEDIFIRDNHKCWDVEGDAAGVSAARAATVDSWQLASIEAAPTKFILPCFQSEFNNIPFCKFISDEKKCNKLECTTLRIKCDATKTEVNTDDYSNSSSELVNVIETQLQSDKKKRTNTLSDVISRIKKDSSQINLLLTQELKEKVKTDSNGLKINEIMPEDIDLSPKTTQNGSSTNYKMKTELDSEEDTTNGSVSGSGYSNEGPSASASRSGGPNTNTNNSTGVGAGTGTVTGTGTGTTSTTTTSTSTSMDTGAGATTSKLNIKDTAGTLKRRRMSDYEDECYTKDEASLCLLTDTQDAIAKRCVAISNILRNLTFIPGNEGEFAKNAMFLSLLGKLLLLYHEHPIRTQKIRNYDREEDADFVDSCSSLQGEYEWWWEFLVQIRENVLVSLANIAGHMDLSQYAEDVARPILDGLLHWAICPSAHGQDPFPNVGPTSLLSPQRLALEALCKLCVTDSNVDLVIATPPFSRLERLCAVLTKHLCRSEDQVLREFSVNLLHYLAAADSTMARVVATQNPCVSLLVAFIEQAEQSALGVANQHGIGALRENPDSMGTSLDMLRRAAGTLLYLAKHPDNRPLFMQQEQRLLQLVMSQILDQQVAFVIARVLFHISRTNENNSTSTNS